MLWQSWSRNPPLPLISCVPGYCRSWDLNKICYKSGVPLIENGMIERVSVLSCSLRLGGGGTFLPSGRAQRNSEAQSREVGLQRASCKGCGERNPGTGLMWPGVSLADD